MAIILHAPSGAKPPFVKLHRGGVARLDHEGRIRIDDEDDALDLERRGWRRDLASEKFASWKSDMLRKSMDAQSRHTLGAGDASRRRELGEIEIFLDGEQRRIRVSNDPGEGTLNLHGVMIRTAEIDTDLARGFEQTAARFNELQGREEQATQRALLGALLDRILRRHPFAADAVVRQLDHERFTAV